MLRAVNCPLQSVSMEPVSYLITIPTVLFWRFIRRRQVKSNRELINLLPLSLQFDQKLLKKKKRESTETLEEKQNAVCCKEQESPRGIFKNTLKKIKADKLTRMWFAYLELSCFRAGVCLISDMTMISVGVIILRQYHTRKRQSQAWRGLIINTCLNPLRKLKVESHGFGFVCTSRTKSLDQLM